MNNRKISLGRTGIIVLLFVCWFIILMKAFSRSGLNSDMAGMIIEADEILSGNFFLRGRYLTGLTFLTTDLLFFVIGGLFFGMSGKTLIMAQVLMYFASALATLLMIYDINHNDNAVKKNRVLLILAFLLCLGFPCMFMIGRSSVHLGCFAECLFAVYFLKRAAFNRGVVGSYIAAAVFMTMACMGDSLAYVAVIIPIIIFSIVKIFWWLYEDRKETLNTFYWITIAVAAGSAILGKVLTAIYLSIGNVELNAYIGTHKFIDLNQLYDKLILFINGAVQLFGAGFSEGTVSSVDALTAFAKFFLVMGIIVGIMICSVKYCIRNDDCKLPPENYSAVILGLGFILISILMLFTNFSVNLMTTRYFCYLPFVAAVWLSAWLNSCRFSANKMGRLFLAAICLVFIIQDARILILDTNGKWFSFEPSPVGKEEMVDKLQELGLKNGYSDFWDANYSTVQSEGRIEVNSINNDGVTASVKYWFSAPEYYKKYTDFVIAGDRLSPETVQNIFGTPKLVEEAAGRQIMVYDYDLSKAIRFADEDGSWYSEMEKENIYTCLSFHDDWHNEIAYDENGTRYLPCGALSFGPYISLQAGIYEVEIVGKGLDRAVYSAYTYDGDHYAVTAADLSENKGVFKVELSEPTEKFEFCLENMSEEPIEIRQMFIRKN